MENPSSLNFAQQAADKKDDRRLQYLKLTADLTQNFLITAIRSCCVITEEKLRNKVKEILENYSKEVGPKGTLGKLISSVFFLNTADDEINNRLESILQLHEEINSDQSYSNFDKNRACDILLALGKQFDRWDSKYQEDNDTPNYALQLRPQIEQAIRQQNKEVKTKIDELLTKVKALITKHYKIKNFSKDKPEDYQPACFISYAWPLLEEKPHEAWTQTFILQFALDLRQAGVNAKIDLLHSRYGHDSIAYMNNGIKNSDYIILFGTESLHAKHVNDKKFGSAIRNEINLIKERIRHDRANNRRDRVFVMLLTGTIKTSLPADFEGYTVIESFQNSSYLSMLQETLQWMYKLSPKSDPNNEFEKSWQDLKSDSLLAPLFKGLEESAVEKYYAHKQKFTQEEHEKHKQDSKSLVDNLIATEEIKSITFDKWHLPFPNQQNFIPRKELQEKIVNAFNQSVTKYTLTILTTLHGLGGVGKTLLAADYIHGETAQKKYAFRSWFLAESEQQLFDEYIAFAKELGIASSLTSSQSSVTLVKRWLEDHTGWLLVYDNVPNFTMLEQYLPQKGGHILITSQNPNWQNPILVDIMSAEESIALVKKFTQRNDAEIPELVEELGRLPLALAQASAYIFRKNITVKDYLEHYKQSSKTLLNDKSLPTGHKHNPVAITWDINITTIKGANPLASDLLYYCAYLAPEKIPFAVFYDLLEIKEIDFADLKQILLDYSMVKSDPDTHTLSIHRVVQKILQIKLEEEKKHQEIFKKCITVVDKKINYNWNNILTGKETEPYVTHGLKLAEHSRALKLEPEAASNILLKIGTYYLYHCRVPLVAEQRFLEALDFCNSSESEQAAIVYNHLSYAYVMQENYPKAKEFNNKAYIICSKLPDSDKNLCLAFSFRVKSNILRDAEKNFTEAIDCCNDALKIQNKYFNNEPHISIARTEHDLGRIYYELGDFNNAKKQYEKCLDVAKEYHKKLDRITTTEYPSTPNTARTFHELGKVFERKNETSAAITNFNQAITLKKNILQDVEHHNLNHPWVAETYYCLGRVYVKKQEYPQAKHYLELAMGIFRSTFGEENKNTKLCQEALKEASELISKLNSSTRAPLWNVPYFPADIFVERDLTNQIQEKLHANPNNQLHLIALTALHGLSGVGKTLLALNYCHKKRSYYSQVLWFYADNLDHEYLSFALDKGLISEKELSHSNTVKQRVHDWLKEHRDWLIIYDNAKNFEQLKPYLSAELTGDVVVTSLNPDWPNSVEVDVMEPEQAIELIRKIIQTDDPNISDLASTLGYLPLALTQAAAYIKGKIKVTDYLLLYKREKVLLQHDKLPAWDEHAPVYTTFNLILQKIKSTNRDTAHKAIELLDYLSLLSPDKIPYQLMQQLLFDKITDENSYAFNFILDELIQYSLLKCNLEEKTGNLHLVVQKFIKFKLTTELYNSYLDKIIQFSNKTLAGFSRDKFKNNSIMSYILFNSVQILQVAQNSLNKIELLFRVATAYNHLGELRNAEKKFEEALQAYRDCDQTTWDETAKIQGRALLADIYQTKGTNHTYLEQFKKAEKSLREAKGLKYKKRKEYEIPKLFNPYYHTCISYAAAIIYNFENKKINEKERACEFAFKAIKAFEEKLQNTPAYKDTYLPFQIAEGYIIVGSFYLDKYVQGKYRNQFNNLDIAEAEKYFNSAKELYDKYLPQDHVDRIRLYNKRAFLKLAVENIKQAEENFGVAEKMEDTFSHVKTSHHLCETYLGLAIIHRKTALNKANEYTNKYFKLRTEIFNEKYGEQPRQQVFIEKYYLSKHSEKITVSPTQYENSVSYEAPGRANPTEDNNSVEIQNRHENSKSIAFFNTTDSNEEKEKKQVLREQDKASTLHVEL